MKDQKVDWSAVFGAVENGVVIRDIELNILGTNSAPEKLAHETQTGSMEVFKNE